MSEMNYTDGSVIYFAENCQICSEDSTAVCEYSILEVAS